MAENLNLALTLTAEDTASPTLAGIHDKLDQLHNQLEEQKKVVPETTKDWGDYAEQTARTAEALVNIANGIEQLAITTAGIGTAIVVYQKWRAIVEGVREAHVTLQTALETARSAGLSAIESGWGSVQLQAEKLEARLGSLTARFLEFGKIANALGAASVVLAIAQIGVAADESNEKTRLLTEQVGGLTTSLQALDPASKPVEQAKARFEELYKASLALGTPIEQLLPIYKAFFDLADEGTGSLKGNAAALTDYLNVQKSLVFSSEEAKTAQENVTAAYDTGVTSVEQLSTIFGAALNPALDSVAARMGITRDQLKEMIDSGEKGTVTVFPALAAAAHSITAPLSSAGEAATFSKRQFDAMGLSFYDLSASKLPGVTNALKYTAQEFPATINAAVDPIGAAVEQIENFGNRIVEWGRLTKQSIVDAFSGVDVKKALSTGLQESMYALDLILVSARETITATGESLGILAGAAVTATNPIEALNERWISAGDAINDSRAQLQAYIDALEGVDQASERTTAATDALDQATDRTAISLKNLAEAVKTLPTIPLPEALQSIIDKMTATEKASDQVAAAWNVLKGLDFTGTRIQGLLVLRQAIEAISAKTGDAIGTQEQFSKVLAAIPDKQFDALLAKVTALKPQLEEAGDKGQVFGAVMGAAFQRTIEAATLASAKITDYAKAVEGVLTLEEKQGATSEVIIKALNQEANAFQSVTEKAAAEATILEATAAKAALHAQASQALAVSKDAEADASQAVYEKLQQEVAGLDTLTDAEKKGLESAKADADQKAIVAAQAREVTVAAQLEAAQMDGVAQAHRLSAEGAATLVGSLEGLKQVYQDAAAAAEILKQNQLDGIATKEQVTAAIAEEMRALSEYNAAVDLTKKAFAQLGLDADQVLTGMDAKFKETIQVLQNLAENGKLTGAALTQALQSAIKTADSQAELKALNDLIVQLGKDGKLSGQEITLALDAVKDKLLQVHDAIDPVAQAFKLLGIQSHDALNQAAQDAKDAFDTIKNSGTATTGDLNAAFAAMAEKVMEAGKAAGPVGLAMAEAALRAKAATEEQQKALEDLIAKYDDSGKAATSAAAEQVQAAHTAAAAIEDYATRVEARAGAGAQAFQQTTTAIQQTTQATQALNDSQQRQIQGYNDLSEAGKAWADSLIRQAMAADASQAGMLTYRDETGRTIREIQQQIETEETAAKTAETLGKQYEAGAISAGQYEFALRQLVFQMGDRVTSAGDAVAQKLKELEQQMHDTQSSMTTDVNRIVPILQNLGNINFNNVHDQIELIAKRLDAVTLNADQAVISINKLNSISLQ